MKRLVSFWDVGCDQYAAAYSDGTAEIWTNGTYDYALDTRVPWKNCAELLYQVEESCCTESCCRITCQATPKAPKASEDEEPAELNSDDDPWEGYTEEELDELEGVPMNWEDVKKTLGLDVPAEEVAAKFLNAICPQNLDGQGSRGFYLGMALKFLLDGCYGEAYEMWYKWEWNKAPDENPFREDK